MAYEALASAYDALTYDIAYGDALRFMQQLLADAGLHPETVVDLACGTGSLSVRLAAQGYRVYGVDLSEEMLTQAAEKAMQMENPPYFVCQDMCKLELPEPVDWIVCMLDSVNYILDPADCAGMMRHVAECLKPGGMFIFDINTPEKLRALDGQVFLDETEDDYCVWRTEFDEQARICYYGVDLFERRGEVWVRSFEEHQQYAYTPAELEQALRAAGFTAIRAYADGQMIPPRQQEQRIYFTARKEA